MRNCRIGSILAALLGMAVATVSNAADEDSCPAGQFGTDLAQITRSFGKPDTRRVEPFTLPGFPGTPAEIARIRSGVIWEYVDTDFGPHFLDWKAYDAERHLFIVAYWGDRDQFFSSATHDRCDGYQLQLYPHGDWAYCMTIVAATPAEASEFACRANRIYARLTEEAARAAARWEAERQKREADLAKARAALEAEAALEMAKAGRKPGAMPQVLVLGSRMRRLDFGIVHGPIRSGYLLKDGKSTSFDRDAALDDWVSAIVGSSDSRLARALRAPAVTDIAVDKRGSLYVLVEGDAYVATRVLKLSRDGQTTAMFPRLAGAAVFKASRVALDDADLTFLGGFHPRVMQVPLGSAAEPIASELTIAPATQTPALDAFGSFDAMVRDSQGDLYLSTGSQILKRSPGGRLTLFAGSAITGHADGVGAAATFSAKISIAVAPDGALVVADTGNDLVRRVSRNGVVTTIAGRAGVPGSFDGVGTQAFFNEPGGIAVDSDGYIYVADTGNQTLRKITPQGRVSTLVGQVGTRGTRDGRWGALLDDPTLIAIDSVGTLYVANEASNTIRRVSAAGAVTTLNAEEPIERAILAGP